MNKEIDFYIDIEYDGNKNDFDCGFDIFNSYLKHNILEDKAAMHYITDAENDNLIAYFSLLASCIFLNEFENSNIIPAVEIKMYAVDKKYQKLHLGEKLLESIYKTIRQYSLKYIGAKAVVLYSVPAEKVVQMYETGEYKKMPENYSMYKSSFNEGCVPMYKFIK